MHTILIFNRGIILKYSLQLVLLYYICGREGGSGIRFEKRIIKCVQKRN